MRLSFFMMLMVSFAATANVGARAQKVTVNFRDAELRDVLRSVREQSGMLVIFSESRLERESARVTVRMEDAALQDVLDAIFSDIPYSYSIEGNKVIIMPRETAMRQQPENVSIRGRVTDDSGRPLAGVTVLVKGTMQGTATDGSGAFTLTTPRTGSITLVFSYIGMRNAEAAYTGGEMAVTMHEDATQMEGVVVKGIFERPRESYTGAANQIRQRDLEMAGTRSVLSSISNIDPAFNMLENNLFGSDPNNIKNMAITMRGGTTLTDVQTDAQGAIRANMPLFIIDGFESSLERVVDLDEGRVENITLLKDASATALYGSKGSNGVVVITTRKPAEGKLRVSYKGSVSFEAPDLSSYDLMNSREKLDYELAAGLYTVEGSPLETDRMMEIYNARRLDSERGVDTYWLRYPVRLGVGNKHSVTIEGGQNAIRYSVNVSNNNIKGAMKGSDRNTLSGGMFLSYTVSDLIFSNDLRVSRNKAHNSNYGSFSEYGRKNAYWKPYDDEGNLVKILDNVSSYRTYYNGTPDYPGNEAELSKNRTNPLWDAKLPMKDESSYTEIVNNFQVEWRIRPELFLRGRFSLSVNDDRSDYYLSSQHTSFADYTGDDISRKGRYEYTTGESFSYEGEVTANFSKTFCDKHQLYAGIGANIYQQRYEWYTITAEGLNIPYIDFLAAASQYEKGGHPLGSDDISRGVKAFALVNYTYDGRYFADLSGTVEGSSKFGADRRTAPFWSVGAGWNLHAEDFLRGNKVINIARLRASYGATGSVEFSPYQALRTYEVYPESSRNRFGMNLISLGNPDLGWQKTNSWNVGADVELFDSRVTLRADVYERITNDLITSVNLPPAGGFSSYVANVGKVSNAGVEAELKVNIIRNYDRRIHWTVGATMVHNKNKILSISDELQTLNESKLSETGLTEDEITQKRRNPTFLYKEGESINTIFAVKSKGIDPSTGREIFVKADGTETFTWDSKDRVACGVDEPTLFGNIYTTFRYRAFTLSAYFSYQTGGYHYNQTLADKVENIYPYMNADRRVLYDRWQEVGDRTLFKGMKDFTKTNATSRFVMKDNTFRCSSISLRYDVPHDWSQKHLGIEFISLQGTVQDVFYISTIKRERGLDYPFSNKFSFTATINF